jgi:lipopolysaccharide export system permease protein
LATFAAMLLMFIPIGIIIDVSEKENKMIKQPLMEIAIYYYHFTIYFANSHSIFLFLSIIWFIKTGYNTEIIAI